MKKLSIIMLMVVLMSSFIFSLTPTTVKACSCVMPPSVDEEVEVSAAVFTGEVIDIEKKSRSRKVTFEVSNTWKGVTKSEIVITTGLNSADCGFPFEVGESYLLYANESSMYEGVAELSTTICDRTAAIEEAQQDLETLGEGKAPVENVKENDTSNNGLIYGASVMIVVLFTFVLWRKMR
ncbi:hypothetical protein [Pontibacillus yanchengensis]|uniref:Tissue inhibitor of metalloproteinase n=1 Tax=Pontibacillus yanchengensis Y32 TaxID=1385514 RepID=A0A0A2TAB5_9BACI|nr:hypothetical protein [Pontibacillus yanchengensis]KGP72767.1 hypothetical protein N782_10395 [Pontibacillus yanchengensis Y32]